MNIPVIVWILTAMVAGRFNAVIWWDAVADYRWAESGAPSLERVLTARDQLMVHSFLFAIQIVMLTVGVVALLFPTTNPDKTFTVQRLVVVGGLILVEVMLAVMAVWSRHNWLRITRMLARKRAGGTSKMIEGEPT